MRAVITATVLLLALLAGAYLAFQLRFYPDPPSPRLAAARNAGDERAQDMAVLQDFARLHRFASAAVREEYDRRHADLARAADGLSAAEFRLALMRLLAGIDNGHTNLVPWPWIPSNERARLPVRFYRFSDGIAVLRADREHARCVGGVVTTVSGRPVGEVLATLRPYIGGKDAFFDWWVPFFFESPELLHAAGISETADRVRFGLRLADGSPLSVTLKATPDAVEAYRNLPSYYLSSQPHDGSSIEWERFVPAGDMPFAFENPEERLRFRMDGENRLAYLQIRINGGPGFAQALAGARRQVEAARPRAIILDVRFDSGGDYTATYAFLRRLPDLLDPQDGRVVILVGSETFSAGIYSAAFAKEAAENRATIIGSAPGDAERFQSEGGFLTLPHSAHMLWYNTGLHDVAAGCTDPRRCFWLNILYPVAAGSIAPTEHAPISFASYAAGRDEAMDKARQIAKLPVTP